MYQFIPDDSVCAIGYIYALLYIVHISHRHECFYVLVSVFGSSTEICYVYMEHGIRYVESFNAMNNPPKLHKDFGGDYIVSTSHSTYEMREFVDKSCFEFFPLLIWF